jgi:hypothetical protein
MRLEQRAPRLPVPLPLAQGADLEQRATRLPVPLPLAQGADPIYAHVARLLVNPAVAPLPAGRVPIPSNHRAVARLARPV